MKGLVSQETVYLPWCHIGGEEKCENLVSNKLKRIRRILWKMVTLTITLAMEKFSLKHVWKIWLGHVSRMESDSPMKSLLYSELTEVVGHHKLRYKDMCKSVLKWGDALDQWKSKIEKLKRMETTGLSNQWQFKWMTRELVPMRSGKRRGEGNSTHQIQSNNL